MEDLTWGLTFFYKFVFPTVTIGILSLITLLMFVDPDGWEGTGPDVRDIRWFLLGIIVVLTGFMYRTLIRLKRVSIAPNEFVITNYLHTIRVPFRDVERASASVMMFPQFIWLHFRRPTKFGNSIVFMPNKQPWAVSAYKQLMPHPLTARLNNLLKSHGTNAMKPASLKSDKVGR
jgi:hypothetical protein